MALIVQEHFSDIQVVIECERLLTPITVNPGDGVLSIIRTYERVSRTSALFCQLKLRSSPQDVLLCDTGHIMDSEIQTIVNAGIEYGSTLLLIRYRTDIRDGLGPVTPKIKTRNSRLA